MPFYLPHPSPLTPGAHLQAAGSITKHWWGYTLAISNQDATRIQNLLTAGAGVAAVATAITAATGVGAAVAGVIAGVLMLGLEALAFAIGMEKVSIFTIQMQLTLPGVLLGKKSDS